MDPADPGSRHRNSLPSIVNLDLDRVKVESDYQRPSIQSQRPSEMSLANPSSVHSGPPPPYSYPSSTASSAPGITGYISPPDSRRTYEEDKEPKAPRQSLPSIHEALGADKSLAYPTSVPKTQQQQPPHPAHPAISQPGSSVAQRPHQDGAPIGPPNPFSQNSGPPYLRETPYTPRSQPESSRPNPNLHHQDNPTPAFMPVNGPRSPPPPRSAVQPYPPSNYPASYEYQSKPGPTVASSPRSYNHPQDHYVYSSQPQSGAPVYAPAQYDHRPYPNSWKAGPEHQYEKYAVPRGVGPIPPHNESIKRQLDVFDLETSLNEVAEGSQQVVDFARVYGARGHQTDRTGPVPGSTPSVPELDDILRMHARVGDTLARIRGMAINQQHMAEQRVMNQSFEGAYDEDGNPYNDDYKGNSFAGGDAKKRRGKAAPPGRCHSCNRAETPEWRRGPDGARTLCNACGLHYAKLTRKMGAKGASIAGSNLRPKNMES